MGFPTLPPKTNFTRLEWTKKTAGVSTYASGIYCGPGWGFTYQDLLDGRIKEMPKAIDAIDEACRLHDTCYHEHGYLTQGCNLVLVVDLVKVVVADGSSPQQRVDATVMAAIFLIESQTIDLGKMAFDEVERVRVRILGFLAQNYATMQQAILREISLRGGGGWPKP